MLYIYYLHISNHCPQNTVYTVDNLNAVVDVVGVVAEYPGPVEDESIHGAVQYSSFSSTHHGAMKAVGVRNVNF